MRVGLGVGRWRWAGVALAAFAAVGAGPQAGDVDWLPLAIFGIVALCVFPLLLACYSLCRRPRVDDDDGMQHIPPREPARLPVDLEAVHERAPTSRPSRPRDGAEESGPEDGIRADLPPPAPPAPPRPAEPERPRPIPPGGAAARCSKCRWVIVAGGTPKLWCPNCGADLKLVFDEVKPEVPAAEAAPPVAPVAPAAPAPAPAPAAESLETPRPAPPPYFHGRTDRRFRVYVLPDELLFLEAPGLCDPSGAENMVRGVSVMFGLVGALVGSAVNEAIAAGRRSSVRERLWHLDTADAEQLRALADSEKDSYRVATADLAAVTVEALTFWQRCFTDKVAARLHFDHPERGRTTVVLPESEDVRQALQLLPEVFGERLSVNARWDYTKNRYVPER